MFDFSDQVVLVTGAGGNLGNAVALAFQTAGAKLVLTARRAADLAGIFPPSDSILLHDADLTDPSQVEGLVAASHQKFGRLHVLANTVGGFRSARLAETTPEDFQYMLDLNLKPAFLISRAVVPGMLSSGAGRIIHVSARSGLSGAARQAAYSAAKGGVIRLVESLAAELKQTGITVNCVLPGTIDTPENRTAMPDADFSRWVPPALIASVFLFLASDAASAVSGAAIPVYGRS